MENNNTSTAQLAFIPPKFSTKVGGEFNATLKKRVRAYFKDNNISKYANANMKFKTVFMLSLYFVPYFLMITGTITNIWGVIACWALLGFGMAGIGMTIIHDANHGAYSKNKRVNYVLGRCVNLVGAFAPNWKIQHNVLHHTYTNIQHFDEDVDPPVPIIRFTPHDKLRPIHRFQFLYAWFFYSLMTAAWITIKDWQSLFRYKKMGLTKNENEKFSALFFELLISKAVYYTYILVLPIIFLDIPWWGILLLLLMKQMISGFTLAIVFILAHVVPEAAFPLPDKDLKMENSWAIHQLETTSNFGPKSRIFQWFIGGLNYQVEHHLFPNICHVHYKKLSEIVKATALEFGLPYYSEPTFFSAIRSHSKMLYKLGRPAPQVKSI
ncbi:MAG: acyl-CoA desaturase [Crocinitomix sp.]|nr:acyl-CoA desaturase [Crocinitomix sp.]